MLNSVTLCDRVLINVYYLFRPQLPGSDLFSLFYKQLFEVYFPDLLILRIYILNEDYIKSRT